jgi:hypothetical protein
MGPSGLSRNLLVSEPNTSGPGSSAESHLNARVRHCRVQGAFDISCTLSCIFSNSSRLDFHPSPGCEQIVELSRLDAVVITGLLLCSSGRLRIPVGLLGRYARMCVAASPPLPACSGSRLMVRCCCNAGVEVANGKETRSRPVPQK